MQAPILLPDLGATPATLSAWFADVGDHVFEGDRLVEVLVAGATFDIPAPATGQLVEQRAFQADRLDTGQVLGTIEVEEPRGMS